MHQDVVTVESGNIRFLITAATTIRRDRVILRENRNIETDAYILTIGGAQTQAALEYIISISLK